MIKYYAQPGTIYYTIDLSTTPTCPDGCIEMLEERPGLNYIATEDGQWIKVEDSEIT